MTPMTLMTTTTRVFGILLVVLVMLGLATQRDVEAQSPVSSFAWFGELVSFDRATKTVTVKAPIEEHVARYLSNFEPGMPIVMAWMQFDAEADAVRYVERAETMTAESGYIVRGRYVAADTSGNTLMFEMSVPDGVVQTLSAAAAGTPIKVVSPIVQPGAATPVTSVALNETPKPRPEPEPEPIEVFDGVQVGGTWALQVELQGNPIALTCQFTLEGAEFGGTCGGPGPLGELTVTGGRVDGNDVKFQFDVTSFGPRLTFLLTGELDAAGTTIEGMLNMAGMDSPFTAVKQ